MMDNHLMVLFDSLIHSQHQLNRKDDRIYHIYISQCFHVHLDIIDIVQILYSLLVSDYMHNHHKINYHCILQRVHHSFFIYILTKQ